MSLLTSSRSLPRAAMLLVSSVLFLWVMGSSHEADRVIPCQLQALESYPMGTVASVPTALLLGTWIEEVSKLIAPAMEKFSCLLLWAPALCCQLLVCHHLLQ